MRDVVGILRTMGPEQLFLALVFLAGYALALGEFATARGRVVASVTALIAAAGFAALSNPWEGGIVLLGFASVGMALFSGAAWTLWLATTSRASPIVLAVPLPVPVAVAVDSVEADQSAAANLARTRATSAGRSRNSAPILNSPGAE
jgi:hypothetical protein